MGLYIPNMEKPASCRACPFNLATIDEVTKEVARRCFITWRKIAPLQACPLIEVQTPHGRLIDADALRLSHCKECLDVIDDGCDVDAVGHIDYAKTIIEKEGEK